MILGLFWEGFEFVLAKRNDGNWYGGGITRSYEKKNYYDVVFAGTSMVLANINVEELYLKYGIAGVTTGEPEQPVYLSYYTLEEVLKYQNPQAVFFDVRAMFYSDELIRNRINMDENLYAHYTIDQMKNNRTKYDAYKAEREIAGDINIWDYFSKMYYNHSNWESIKKNNFQNKLEVINRINGNTTLFDIAENLERNTEIQDINNDGDKEEISDFNWKYFFKIVQLCKNKDIDLVLLRGHTESEWTWSQYNTIAKIATEYELDYIDINLCEKKIDFDWSTDSADGGHLNIIGAKKWTDYIGKYIKDKYNIDDHRNDSKYNEFIEQEQKYYTIMNAVQTKVDFLKKVTFEQYISELQENDLNNNRVYIIANREVFDKLKDDIKNKLYDEKYIKSIKNSDELNGEEENGLCYLDKDTVEINSKQSELNENSVNIIVFNTYINQIISSVYFDFSGSDNPSTCRIIKGKYNEVEKEINKWVRL